MFVVASAREGFDPAEVLFEFDGVRRDSPPSREAREEVTGTLSSRTTGGGGLGTDFECAGGLQVWPAEVAPTLNAAFGSKLGLENQHIRGGQDYSSLTFDRQSSGEYGTAPIASTMSARDFKSPSDLVLTPTIGGVFVDAPVALSVALRGREGGATAELGDEIAGCLRASSGGGDKPHVLAPIAFDSYAIQAGALRTNPNSGPDGIGVQEHIAYTLEARAEVQAVAFVQNSRDEVRLMNGDGQIVGALAAETGAKQQCYIAQCVTGEITHTLKAEGFDASEDGTGRGQPIVAHLQPIAWSEELTASIDVAGTIQRGGSGGRHDGVMQSDMAVRRLTPVECARLQGFPDDYLSQVLVRGKPMADGPMYKALGNSWAVPNVRWIGARIDARLRALSGSINAQQ